jgi:hypothetical protein
VPPIVQKLRIVELTFDHEAPYFSNMRRRNSRKDSDLTGVVDVRYTGGARMLLLLEVGACRAALLRHAGCDQIVLGCCCPVLLLQ